MRLTRRERLSWGVALGLGLVLRALFVWLHPRFVGDTLVYGDLAHNLLTQHVYGLTEEGHVRATLNHEPAYHGGYGRSTGAMWRAFQQRLAAADGPSADAAVAAATDTFRRLRTWLLAD